MEVKLDKRYPLPVTVDQAWAVLRDVRAVAGCMPGAAITEQLDAAHYKGTVKVKVGPATAAFGGDITVGGIDEAARRMRLLGKGADRSGSTASMDLDARVEAGQAPGDCVLVGEATVQVNGKFAQFGGRLMGQVSEMILAQFADNFRAAAQAVPVAEAVVAAPAQAAEAPVPEAPVAPPPTQALNAGAIVWQLLKQWLAGLFGRRSAG
ncbi:MAG: SRPBCC family protein [Burkholderiaceae bacterium]|nr:SRPBCC family protein [Burkholderiaceae bacterium]